MPEREPADQLFAVGARAGSVDPVAAEGLPTLVLRSRLWRSRSDRVDRLAILCCSSRERVAAEVSCLGVAAGVCPPTAVCPDHRGVVAVGDVVPAEGLGFAVSDCGVYRKTCERSVVADEEEPPKVDDRVHVLELLLAGGSARPVEAVSLRRDAKRSDSDPREDQLDPDVPGEDVRGWIVSTLVPSVEEGDRAMLSVPIRLPMLGREASDGCGGFPNAEDRVWEPGKALVEKELDRCELLPGSNLRKLVAGAWLAGGLNEGRDGATEDDLPAPKEGPEGRDGADRG